MHISLHHSPWGPFPDRFVQNLAFPGQPTSWPASWLASWTASWPAGWPAGWPASWPAGWPANWPAGQVAGQLTGARRPAVLSENRPPTPFPSKIVCFNFHFWTLNSDPISFSLFCVFFVLFYDFDRILMIFQDVSRFSRFFKNVHDFVDLFLDF